jgi:hypothetical protein
MKQKELLILSITVFTTILAWVLLDVISVKKKISLEQSVQKVQPINFSLDQSTFSVLLEKSP